MREPVRSREITLIDILAVLAVLGLLAGLFIFPILLPLLHHERFLSMEAECGRQLSDIGRATLSYANDYAGALPQAGGKGTKWGPRLRDWSASNQADAFGLDPNSDGGEATIGASLYLLVRHNGLSPKSFICRADKRVTEFRPQKYGVTGRGLADLWVFGPDPARHCSYSYHVPYGGHALTTANEPGYAYAVAADRSPWIDSPFAKAKDFSRFKPDWRPFTGTAEQARYGNTFRHYGEGQSVLFLDGHIEFAKRAYCSIEDDNIYTVSRSPSGGDVLGTPPTLGSQPANKKDSLLVNDPPIMPSESRRR